MLLDIVSGKFNNDGSRTTTQLFSFHFRLSSDYNQYHNRRFQIPIFLEHTICKIVGVFVVRLRYSMKNQTISLIVLFLFFNFFIQFFNLCSAVDIVDFAFSSIKLSTNWKKSLCFHWACAAS